MDVWCSVAPLALLTLVPQLPRSRPKYSTAGPLSFRTSSTPQHLPKLHFTSPHFGLAAISLLPFWSDISLPLKELCCSIMSNAGLAQGSQGSQGSGSQLLRAEDVLKLTCINDDQKTKYKPAVSNLWSIMENKAQDSPEYRQARAKLAEWSQRLIAQERAARHKAQQAAQQAGNRPQSQQGQQAQQGQGGQGQQRQPLQNAPSQTQTNPQGTQPPQINPEIIRHVQSFPYHLPPGAPSHGTAEYDKQLKEMRNSYLMALNKQEKATHRVKSLNQAMDQRKAQGQDVPQELINQKAVAEQDYNAGKQYVDEFRKKQALWKEQQQRQQPQQQSQQSVPQIKTEASSSGGQPFNIQLSGGQQAQQPSHAQGQSIAGIEAARSQAAARNTQSINNSQQSAQTASSFTQSSQPPGAPSAQLNQQPNSANASRPQINPQQQQNSHQMNTMQQQQQQPPQQQHNSPHPQSATSNNPSGPPVPLSHQAAVTAAARSYSNPDPQRTVTPQQIPTNQGGGYHTMGNREQLNNPKMPIPKTLNVSQPQPVPMGPARPTMGGPSNGAPGMMGQPVINKFPPFQLEGEGDRILSKRKLDELVRQVTGGGEGPGGESLTPEVEEV